MALIQTSIVIMEATRSFAWALSAVMNSASSRTITTTPKKMSWHLRMLKWSRRVYKISNMFNAFFINTKKDDNNWEEQDYSGSVSERDDPGEEAAEIEEDGDMMQVVEFGAEELEDDDGDNHVFAGNAVYQYVDMIKLLSSHTSSMIAQGQVDESDDDEAIDLTIQEASNESGTEEESEISEAYSEF
ncbi:unnamed protein product [Oikopleura dioica]|uniref:Uncharacterized protein n=1 Tax=Oikopleura dioica TaxID=34765 RepID=E4YGW0_OIKDI|nr:unnamed protein product [Oikopleura dioica]